MRKDVHVFFNLFCVTYIQLRKNINYVGVSGGDARFSKVNKVVGMHVNFKVGRGTFNTFLTKTNNKRIYSMHN